MHGRWYRIKHMKHIRRSDGSIGPYRRHSQLVNKGVITQFQMIQMIKSRRDVDGIFCLVSEHGHLLQGMHVACVLVTVSKLCSTSKYRLQNQQKRILDSCISRVARNMNLKERQDTLDSYLKLFEGCSEYTGFSTEGIRMLLT